MKSQFKIAIFLLFLLFTSINARAYFDGGMLIRDTTPKSPEEWYENARLTNPGLGRTAVDKMSQGFAAPFIFASHVIPSFKKTEFAHHMQNLYDAIQNEQNIPNKSWVQEGTDFIANVIGYGINPITWVLGILGALIGAIISLPIKSYGRELIIGFCIGIGSGLSTAIVNSYDAIWVYIEWSRVATESLINGIIGLTAGISFLVLKKLRNKKHENNSQNLSKSLTSENK